MKIGRLYLILFMSVFFLAMRPCGVSAEEYSLDDLYQIALQRAEKIKVSEENLYIAETGREKALSLLLPKLSAFGSYLKYTGSKRNDSGVIIQPDEASSWGLRLDESLSTSGRELTALRISKETIAKNRHDLHAIQEEYLFNVAYDYYDVLRAEKGVDIAQSNLDRLQKYRDAAQKRLRVGEVTKTAVLRANGELSGALSDHVKAKNVMELTRSVLARTVGIAPDFKLKEVSHRDIEIPLLPSFQERALLEREDLKSLERQKKIAEEQVKYTKGAFWPTVSLSGVYAGADQDPSSQTLNKESVYAGIALNFPIYEGGLRVAEVKEARSKERQAILIYEDFKKSIAVEVHSAYLDIMTQKGILKFLEDELAYAKDNFYAVSKQFEYGLANSIDVIDANTLLVSSERKLADAVYSYELSILKIKKTTGVLLKTVTNQ